MKLHSELRVWRKSVTKHVKQRLQIAKRRRAAAEVDRIPLHGRLGTYLGGKAGYVSRTDFHRHASTRLERAVCALAAAEREMYVKVVHLLNGSIDQQ